MSDKTAEFKEGLEGIVAASSAVCSIENGVLRYRGIDIHELAQKSNFIETVYLLWYGKLPTQSEWDDLKSQLEANAALPEPVIKAMEAFPKKANFMDVLRTTVSLMAFYDPDEEDNSIEANQRKAIRLTAQLPHLVTAWEHIRNQRSPVHPKKGLGISANFLYMLHGKEPTDLELQCFDQALILHADHEFNASTFAARVTAATLSDMYSAITTAIGTLKGPLHGGANQRVMETLMKIGEIDQVEKFVKEAFEKKERIMGFGHRVYKTGDPRAKELKRMSEKLSKEKGDSKWFEMSVKMDELVQKEKGLLPNVDFYSASSYHMLGIPFEAYTPIFAMSRIAGWTAHVIEQLSNNRLIRPRADYIGLKEASFVPMNQR
ncbi:MAG: citrate synthase [Bradymonadales bacterium]|nr:MAG: citrate synthase [Bradymonadales bacterium]